jgi:putative membrane protein
MRILMPADKGDLQMWGEHMWGWGMGVGMISMVLFWVLVILGIVVLVRWIGNTSASSPPSTTALDILKERYARGEIDKREFEEKKRDLAS